MSTFFLQVLNGLADGSLYALIALGLALIYGILRILHVAHAACFTIGAYLGLWIFNLTGSLAAGLLVSMAGCALFGVSIERLLYYPLLKYPPFVSLIGSIAIYIATEEICRLVAGPDILIFPARLPLPSFHLGGCLIPPVLLAVYLCTALVLFLFWFIMYRTELGLAIRATSQSRDMAGAQGINSHMMITLTFVLGSAIAGVAGVLVAIYYNQVYPTMGVVPAYKSLALIVVGGLGSVPGAVVASLLLGVAETMLIGFAEVPLPREALAFIAMIVLLLCRPQGLFGRR